ncbi:MAG: uracil-DNA glycosylase [Chloroflexota bacterium]|nr:uracil-DNA glycosylase [Chloroflexota bacterium]
MESLQEISELVRKCKDCALHLNRSNAVPGEGSSTAEIMLIGEGPGQQEDRQGRPFVGQAGKFLNEMLVSIGLNRNDVFIGNMVKCRPPGNRDPSPDEINACSKFLDRQIELINPLLIVTLGRFALGRFFPGESITKVRGTVRIYNDRTIFPILHPAAALYRQELKAVILEDFGLIPKILDKLRSASRYESSCDESNDQSDSPEQLALF